MTEIQKLAASMSDDQVSELLSLGLRAPRDVNELNEIVSIELTAESKAQVVSDLKRKILDRANGPTGFARITQATDKQLDELADFTFLTALTSAQLSQPTLDAIRRYGETLAQPLFPEGTRFTGLFIAALACAALRRVHGVKATKEQRIAIDAALKTLRSDQPPHA